MIEKLEIYDMQGELISIQNRNDFEEQVVDEYKETGAISKKVKTIRLMLINSKGRIYLQKRSKHKKTNAGKYDKTVGGHVVAGDSFDMTVIRECAEELGFAAAVLPIEQFEKAVKVTSLEIIGIFKKIGYMSEYISERILSDGTIIEQPHISSFYVGYYDGPIRFVDGESSGVEVFTFDELQQEIKTDPDKFTKDLKFMIKEYADHFLPPKDE